MSVRILVGDVRARLRDLPADHFDCVVTSPPYWGLRDYGVAGQIGLEPTLGEHLAVMTDVFRADRRRRADADRCRGGLMMTVEHIAGGAIGTALALVLIWLGLVMGHNGVKRFIDGRANWRPDIAAGICLVGAGAMLALVTWRWLAT